MTSCLLFHGPGAKAAALFEAQEAGRLIAPPIGDDGLKIEAARAIADWMMISAPGDRLGTLVVGPMDETFGGSDNVLLKSIEEYNGWTIRPYLWANDLGGVTPTIRSRCLERWAPPGEEVEDTAILSAASGAVDAHIARSRLGVAAAVRTIQKGQERAFLAAVADCLSTRLESPEYRALWDQMRPVTRWWNPRQVELLNALWPREAA